MTDKRYEALYLHPNFCDGFYDNEEKRYLKPEEVNELLNYKLESSEIEKILNRDSFEIIEEEKNMSSIKLALEGLGILGFGLLSIAWYIIKLISSIMIAGLISIKLGLTGYYWWFSSIILFCIINKIIFWGNTTSTYQELVNKYSEKTKNSE